MKPLLQKRASPDLLLLLAAGILLSLLYCPPIDIFYDDKEIFRYIGWVLARGGVPYRDVFDHKPPLIYLFNIAGPWGLWVIDTTLVLLATTLFYRLCRGRRMTFPWLLPLLFILLIRNYIVCMGIGMTRAYTAIFLLLFFCLALGNFASRYFWMGLLTAATFFMQQDQLLPLLPFLLYALWNSFTIRPANSNPNRPANSVSIHPANSNPIRPVRNGIMAAAGFAALTLPILLYFGLHHALSPFWDDAFRFNLDWYTERVPLSEKFRSIHALLEGSGCLMPLLIALTLGAAALFLHHANKPLVITALLTVCLSFIALLLSGHSFSYYLLPLSASLPMLVFTVFDGIGESFLLDRKNRLLFGFLLCCLPLYNALQHASHLSTHNDDLVTATPEYAWLRQQPLTNGQVYIFYNSDWTYLYNRLHIQSPSTWIYHYFWAWYPRWDAGHGQLTAIENSLLAHRTRYVMDFSDQLRFRDPSARVIWKEFLERYYQPVALKGAETQHLWELKSPGSAARPTAGPPAK